MEAHSKSKTRKNGGSLALQRVLAEDGAWTTTNVRDQRKFDYSLLPAELPVPIREKVTKMLQERRGKEKGQETAVISKAPWQHELEHHVTRLLQQMRLQPQQFRELLWIAACEPKGQDGESNRSDWTFVDVHKAFGRIRRAAMTLGEETFHMVCRIVRRSEVIGVLPPDAHTVRLVSLYKMQLRQHVTIRAVVECIQQACSGLKEVDESEQNEVGGKAVNEHTLHQRQVKSAIGRARRARDRELVISTRAARASADATAQKARKTHDFDLGLNNKITSVHDFKLRALERLLASTRQRKTSIDFNTLSNEALAQIQERVTAFLYQNRDNYPLWDESRLSREETARFLRTLVATLLTMPLLHNLKIDQALEMAKAMKWQVVAPGNTFVVQNTEIDALYIVMDGTIVSSTVPEPASDSVLCPNMTITSPAWFGELGMVQNAECWSQTLSVQSTQEATLLVLPKSTFEILLHRFFTTGKPFSPISTSSVQPRRPSSSPAVITRRLTKSSIVSARRVSTAVPVAAMEVNVARWHEVRDEALRDYRAGLEAEKRAAAHEARQRAMDELMLTYVKDDHVEFQAHHTVSKSALELLKDLDEYRDLPNELKQDSPSCPTTVSTSNVPNQLREYYRALSTRRSIVRSQQASNAPFDLVDQPSPNLQTTGVQVPIVNIANTVSNSVCTEKENAASWKAKVEEEVMKAPSGESSGCCADALMKNVLSTQQNHSTAAPLVKDVITILPSHITIKSSCTQPKAAEFRKDSEAIWLRSHAKPIVSGVAKTDTNALLTNTRVKDKVTPILYDAKSLTTKHFSMPAVKHDELLDKRSAQKNIIQRKRSHALALPSGQPQSSDNNVVDPSTSLQPQRHSNASIAQRANLQHRMDFVFHELQLSPSLQSDIGLKYANADHHDHFSMAVSLWEQVQQSIGQREIVLKTLRDFEMLASDPRRHFRSISTRRLHEEKERDALFLKLNQTSTVCLNAMDKLWQCCGDHVYLGDRSYRDKMKKDYTELLYEVEQERLHIIYDEDRPRIVPTIDNEIADDTQASLTCSFLNHPRVNVRARSSVALRRPSSRKDRESCKTPDVNATRYVLEDTATAVIANDNQEVSTLMDENQKLSFVVDGADAEPLSPRFRLATPRESIFVPVSLQHESSPPEDEQHCLKKESKVTIQVQQQRQIECLALTRQLNQQQQEGSIPNAPKDAVPLAQVIRPPEGTESAPKNWMEPTKDRQEGRDSLKRLFQHFLTRSHPSDSRKKSNC